MDPTQTAQPDIAQEMYRKNVDLVYANKTLELVHELDEVMMRSQTVGEVTQKFIEKICDKLGFGDGLVAVADEGDEHLALAGITQTPANQAALQAVGVAVEDVRFRLDRKDNDLVEVFLSKLAKISKGWGGLWRPLAEFGEGEGTPVAIYPILIRDRAVGCYAISVPFGSKTLTEFEQTVLGRLAVVFGLAIDKVRTDEQLRETQERELEHSRELLRMKDEFIYITSHDLRTPMTAIKGYVYLLLKQGGQLSEDARRRLQIVYDSSERMIRLIADLLDVSRIEAGRVQLNPEKLDLVKLAKAVGDELQPQILERRLALEVLGTEEKFMAWADKARIQQVLVNLIGNAIKFTLEGGKITVAYAAKDKEVVTTVTDTGVGIPQEDMAKLFTKFGRLDNVPVGAAPVAGTGLGLYISKKIVELSGGKIWVESEVGKGSTFSFSLPTGIL